MAPSISPAKTWEGSVGGIAGALGASVAAVTLLDLDSGVGEALVLGAIIGVVAQLGDLVESRLKRISDVKDSGWLMPGHGGVLDRLDSIVFNLVVVYYFVS
jgi:phosphatidate cytidylyltransferase